MNVDAKTILDSVRMSGADIRLSHTGQLELVDRWAVKADVLAQAVAHRDEILAFLKNNRSENENVQQVEAVSEPSKPALESLQKPAQSDLLDRRPELPSLALANTQAVVANVLKKQKPEPPKPMLADKCCAVCGDINAPWGYNFSHSGDPSAARWYCSEHRTEAE